MMYNGPCIIIVSVQCEVLKVQSYSVNANGDGTIESVRINVVSVLSGLNLERI